MPPELNRLLILFEFVLIKLTSLYTVSYSIFFAKIIRRIRFNPLAKSRRAQIVIDLVSMRPYDVFLLEANDDKPARIVIDVKHPAASARDPDALAGERAPAAGDTREARRIGPESVGDFLVMIDPGHGGEDPGRRNPGGLMEKDLALQFAMDLKRAIDARPGYQAALTRPGDYFVSLGRRRAICSSFCDSVST